METTDKYKKFTTRWSCIEKKVLDPGFTSSIREGTNELILRNYIYTAEPQYKCRSINCMVTWFILRLKLQLEPEPFGRSINAAV